MSQFPYRANLNSPSFPLRAALQGRTIIVKGQDHHYIQQFTSSADSDKDIGVPQAYYMHNVVPSSQGYVAVGYGEEVSAVPTFTTFSSIQLVRNSFEQRAYIAHTSNGKTFYLLVGSSTWVALPDIVGSSGSILTATHVSGVTYLYFSTLGCYTFNFTTSLLVSVTLTGLTVADIKGIVGAAGYLIAWSDTAIAWSSTVDPTDFVPSLITGAGGGAVEGAGGAITACVKSISGFYVYTTSNIVSSVYSGNSRFPFNFAPVPASGGLKDITYVAPESNTGVQYAYTTSGLQAVALKATSVFPEVTDFLSGEVMEDFDPITTVFTETDLKPLNKIMKKRVATVSERYIVISYGIDELTHALIYDSAHKRWGKLKITHTQVFTHNINAPETTESATHSVGFLQKSGAIKVLHPHPAAHTESGDGVLLLGKYQYVRQRTLQIETIEFENINAGVTFAFKVLSALNGKDTTMSTPTLLAGATSLARTYGVHKTGLNHSLLFTGSFELVSLVLQCALGGKR